MFNKRVKKINFLFVFALFLFFIDIPNVLASDSLVVNAVYPATDVIMESTYDNLVFDFYLNLDQSDILNTVVVENIGNATPSREIKKMVLWLDDGNDKFDGLGIDTRLGEAEYRTDFNEFNFFLFDKIGRTLKSGKNRLYLTIDTLGNGSNYSTLYFRISSYRDRNTNNTYDLGDRGIFFATHKVLPNQYFTSFFYYKINNLGDSLAPKIVITSPLSDLIINNEMINIRGEVLDQGGGNIQSVELCVNNICNAATSIENNYRTWKYDLKNTNQGVADIYAKAVDDSNNSGNSNHLKLTVLIPDFVSEEKSIVYIDNDNVSASGLQKIKISVILKDGAGNSVINKKVILVANDPSIKIDNSSVSTDQSGQALFFVSSIKAGSFDLLLKTIDGENVRNKITVSFSQPISKTLQDYDLQNGHWIKLNSTESVYLLDMNNIRHVYPTQKIWESYFGKTFQNIQNISSGEMSTYPLGANIVFKSGTLVKIPSISKVYKVDQGVLHWIKSEAKAAALYGANWATLVRDLPEAFYMDYKMGSDIE